MKNALLEISKIRKIKTYGESMKPLLFDGDVVYFKKTKLVKENDIVVIKKNNKIFTHRIIFKSKIYFISKGDNNSRSDGFIYENQILGKVYKIKRGKEEININDLYLLQSSIYFEELIKIKNLLNKLKINYLFLKGLPLHLLFEKTHPKRLYVDCDILIEKDSFITLSKILKKMRYKMMDNNPYKVPKLLKNQPEQIVFFKMSNGFPIFLDIHFSINFLMQQLPELNYLYPKKMLDDLTMQFLNERQIVKIRGETFPVLSYTNLLLYLLLHFAHHNYKGIFRLNFISKVLNYFFKNKRNSFNKEEFLKKISKHKLEQYIYPSLVILIKLYGNLLPRKTLNLPKLFYISKNHIKYIKKQILKEKVWDEENPTSSGIKRFKNFYHLSSNPPLGKIFTFLDFRVIYFVYNSLFHKIFY